MAVRDSFIYGVVGNQNTVFKLGTQAATPPIQPGTVVHTASVAINGLDLSGQSLALDFGSWVPTTSGDYLVEVAYGGQAEGIIANTLHVGPRATGGSGLSQRQ